MIDCKTALYNYGFLLTTDEDAIQRIDGLDWHQWTKSTVGKWFLYTHPKQNSFLYKKNELIFLLVGHAYNPFTMESDESCILSNLSKYYGTSEYEEYFDQLTGLFFYCVVENDVIRATSDCGGFLGAYYAKRGKEIYFSAYSQMIADICNYKEDLYVSALKKSRLFHLYGWFLPGDYTPYKEIKRIVPNTAVVYDGKFSINRYYPRKQYRTNNDYEQTVIDAGVILHNTLKLICEKWKHPAISLTGGIDSQTTLACASDLQNQFEYFTYVSLDREQTDAEAAGEICKELGLNHNIFPIDTDKDKYPNFNDVDSLVERHNSYIGKTKSSDICKRIVLSDCVDFDVEVKSWLNEVARASRYKIYGKNKLPRKMTPRILTTMYKVFTVNRKSARETDKKFAEYINDTNLQERIEKYGYPWSEFFVWEIVFGGWGNLIISGQHRLSNDITIPYNNRALMDLLLRTPLEKRINDQLFLDIIEHMDSRITDLNIHVVNGNETKIREICEKLYFNVHSHLHI